MPLADWSPTAASNSTTLGVNIAEGCPAANINNAIRQLMADVATGVNVSLLGTFLASSTLANARTALGVSEGSTSTNNFSALTNAANKVPYMTGSDNWSTADFTSFGRSVVACGDAATLNTLLGGVSSPASSFSASSGYVKLAIGATTFIIQWVDFTAAGNGTTSVNFPTAFSSWSRSWVNGANTDDDAQQNGPCVTTHGTSSATVTNAYNSSFSATLIAIGV